MGGDIFAFVNELRNAPEKKRAEEKQLLEKDWQIIISNWLEYIKSYCKCVAEEGGSKITSNLRYFIQSFDERYTEVEDIYKGDALIKKLHFYESWDEGECWSRMRKYFFHYTKGEADKNEQYPSCYGLIYENAVWLEERIRNLLEKEGLQVESNIRYCAKLYTIDRVYVEYNSALERVLAGTDGYYKKKSVEDKRICDITLNISW